MNNFFGSKKVIYPFLVIGSIAVLVMVAVAIVHKPRTDQTKNKIPYQAPITKTEIDSAKLPDKFPADIPQEQGVTILRNDVQTSNDGRYQASRSFVSTKSVEENFQTYQNYFQKSGWTVMSSVSQTRYRSLAVEKGNLSMQVSINDNQTTEQITVDIYLIEKVANK